MTEERQEGDTDAGYKVDAGKPDWSLLPWDALERVVVIMHKALEKYPRDNWMGVAGWRHRYFAAALRHLTAWLLGEKVDPQSGESHLAHAVACTLIMLAREMRG